MKRKSIKLVLCTLLLLFVSAVNLQGQAFFEDIYPLGEELFRQYKVSEIKVTDYDFDKDKGDWEQEGFTPRHVFYNQQGKPVRMEIYFEQEVLKQYDVSLDFEYHSGGRQKIIGTQKSPHEDYFTWVYYEGDLIQKKYTYNPDSVLKYYDVFSYDANDNLLSVDNFMPNGAIRREAKYQYNAENKKITEAYFDGPNSKPLTNVTYTWPAPNKKLRQEKTSQGIDFGSVEYENNDKGRLVKEWTKGPFSSGRTTREFFYMDNGDLIREIVNYDTSGGKVKLVRYEFSFHQ